MAASSLLHPVRDLPAFLAGEWTVERSIDDHRADQRGQFRGSARFTAVAPDTIEWHEHGTLSLGAYTGEATRLLRIVQTDSGWQVRFDDGRPFHPIDLTLGRSAVDHPCAADLYVGEYRVVDHDRLEVRWRVDGPTKNHTIVSTYVREGTSA